MDFDAVVIGAGHAGVEATRALAVNGKKVALITLDSKKIGAMSCNPAIGGVAKGHLVFEVDAMGGLMGMNADESTIQARRLNMRKGPSVRSTRVQCDKTFYSKRMGERIRQLSGVSVIEAEVAGVRTKAKSSQDWVTEVELGDGSVVRTRAIIVTAGTFMRGLMYCGFTKSSGGRVGDKASNTLSDTIRSLGHSTKRLKTGTPARLDARTIDFQKIEEQWGDANRRRFSWKNPERALPQLCCYITHTNERTHDVIRANLDKSPLFSGEIEGVGPRYCPSIEDKIKRFPERSKHQIFIEPEGLNIISIYPNGMSTSLPAEVQLDYLRTIHGLEEVEILVPGYAVEYDSLEPTELSSALMSKSVQGLFFAGQVNRSSGYEEAAAQGLWAGIQALCFLNEEEGPKPDRSRSYMETLVDDLTTKGTEEPYRLFTSRSEYRLYLREDNAGERLASLADRFSLRGEEQIRCFDEESKKRQDLRVKLGQERIRLSKDRVVTLMEYLKRPEVSWESLSLDFPPGSEGALERIEIDAKYSGYIKRIEDEIAELRRIKDWALDPSFDIDSVPGISLEASEKFKSMQPKTVYELNCISGMTPSAVLKIAQVAGKGPVVSHETSIRG